MKKLMPAILLFATLLGGAVWLSGCTQNSHAAEAKEKQLYTCGMHPQVIQDHPGNCPICGMKLTPIRKDAADAAQAAANSSAIKIDPVTIQNMNLRTTEIARGPLRKTIRTVGTIDYNETALADVTTKFKGWIEKLNVDATGQLVHRGEPLFEVNSPELYSAQVEYLLASQGGTNDSGSGLLRESAANKLKFFDVSDAQIAELQKTRQPRRTLQFLAPMDGFVMEKMVVQGQMVDPGMKLYRLADLSIVWIFAQIYEPDLPYVQLGQEAIVKIASLPDREFRGRVTFIYPNVDEKTRTAKVRLEFENPGFFLKPGMFVSAQIAAELSDSALLVPDSAVLRSGQKNTVFLALDNGRFDARTIVLGPEGENGMYQVLSGLNEGDRVVSSGQFMLDSESQLNEAIQKMRGSTNVETPRSPTTNRVSKIAAAKTDTNMVYVCPMPDHVSITYDHPGNCPICNMALVPVTSGDLKKLQPGGKVLYYTCPMPEHNIHADKPGKCPICAMTLIPVMEVPKPVAPPKTNAAVEAPLPTLYTCAMHTDVVFDKPGTCPICKMELLPTSEVPNGKMAEDIWRENHSR